MKQYIGTKVVQAAPAVRYLMKDGNNMVIEKDDHLAMAQVNMDEVTGWEEAYLIVYKDGYSSWCPKKVFEEAYRQTDCMNFGLAIEAMKKGFRVARHGWNGKNMSVAYQKGYPEGIPCNKNTAEAWGMKEGELFKCRPYMQMRCADGTFQMWLASQSDILADDWYIVD